MNLLNIIKNNLFIQNLAASIVSLIPAYLEFSVSKYLAIKKAMLITAQDDTRGSYLEFGIFTGSTFNHAMKEHRKIEKLGYKNMDCEFVGFDSFKGFGHIKKDDEHPHFIDEIFQVNCKFDGEIKTEEAPKEEPKEEPKEAPKKEAKKEEPKKE